MKQKIIRADEIEYERKNKTFHCYRCGILLNDRPLRLNLQEYGKGRYKQYSSTGTHIDLCSSCFKSFVEWVGVNNVKKKIRKRETSKDDWRIRKC